MSEYASEGVSGLNHNFLPEYEGRSSRLLEKAVGGCLDCLCLPESEGGGYISR